MKRSAQERLDDHRKNGIQTPKARLEWANKPGMQIYKGRGKAPSSPGQTYQPYQPAYKVPSGYYSRNELDAGMGEALQIMQNLEQDLTQKKKNMDAVYSMTGGVENVWTAGPKAAYEDAKKAYDAAVPDFLKAQDEYDKAITGWRKTVRAQDQVQKEIKEKEAALKASKQQDILDQKQAILAGGPQAIRRAMLQGSTAPQDSERTQELQRQLDLLKEEAEWSRYY